MKGGFDQNVTAAIDDEYVKLKDLIKKQDHLIYYMVMEVYRMNVI